MKRCLSFAGQRVEISYPESAQGIIHFLFKYIPEGPKKRADQRIEIFSDHADNFGFSRNGKSAEKNLPLPELATMLVGEVIHAVIEKQTGGLALHAAAISRGKQGIWIPGVTGAGKSTLTAWLLTKGFDYLTDELIHVPAKGPGFESFTRPLNIKTPGLGAISTLVDLDEIRPDIIQSPTVTMIPHDHIGVRQGEPDSKLALIMFPHFEEGAALRLERLTPARSGMLLMNSHVNARNLENHGFTQITALTRKTPAIQLTYGSFDQLDGVLSNVIDLVMSSKISGDQISQVFSIINNQATRQRPPDKPNTPPPSYPIPSPSAKGKKRKLTIGMATYDDYDGVYFSVQAIRMYHPEVLEDTEILVVDNHPDGPCSEALKKMENWVKHFRYVPNMMVKGTAVRDFVFREANSDYVMCIDSHVLIKKGAIHKLIQYFDHNPDCNDLLQGPMLRDDVTSMETHFKAEWRGGMYGTWGTDDRASEIDAEPFEIPMQGLALFACRKSAWPGFNPAFHGFGGEEGYIHEKFRAKGNKSVCLPFLRWLHRFERPMGIPYTLNWEDRIRNYFIGFNELGLDASPIEQHFSELLNPEVVERVKDKLDLDGKNPFDFFDAIYCINRDSDIERWDKMAERFRGLGILHRITRLSAIETPDNHHIGCALSHREIIRQASIRGLRNVLVVEDDALFHHDTRKILEGSIRDIEELDWNLFYLGGVAWGGLEALAGKNNLEKPRGLTCTHAIAYNASIFETLLNTLPENKSGMSDWITQETAIDQYLTREIDKVFVTRPMCSIQAEHTVGTNIASSEDFESESR